MVECQEKQNLLEGLVLYNSKENSILSLELDEERNKRAREGCLEGLGSCSRIEPVTQSLNMGMIDNKLQKQQESSDTERVSVGKTSSEGQHIKQKLQEKN